MASHSPGGVVQLGDVRPHRAPMKCQKCQEREAKVHITGTSTISPRSGGESRNEEFQYHFCTSCADEYNRTRSAQSLFPHLHEQPFTERLRVLSITPERTVLRIVRTEDTAAPQEWVLLTSCLPEGLQVGAEITVTLTPAELQWMRGDREL